jgi:hypothetical protein
MVFYKKRSFVVTLIYTLICLSLYMVFYIVEGFSYTFTCTQNPGSVAASAPAVDLLTVFEKPVPPEGCPAGLFPFNRPSGKMCGCPGGGQTIKDNQCTCEMNDSKYEPFPKPEPGITDSMSGMCVCKPGFHQYGGLGASKPICISECGKSSTQELFGIKFSRCDLRYGTVDLTRFLNSAVPPEGCPAGLVAKSGTGGDKCKCPIDGQTIVDNRCSSQ